MRIDTRIITEDIIKVGLKTRKKSPKERNVIDIKNETLFASNVGKRDTLNFQRKINKLDISRNLKDKLMSILEQTDSDETDNEIHQIDNCDITSSSIDISSDNGKVKLCNCNNPDNFYCKRKLKISVSTKQKDIIMDLIDRLPNSQSKKDYLSKLEESLTQSNILEMDL